MSEASAAEARFAERNRTALSAASIPLTRPSGTLSPTGGEGRGEGAFCRPRIKHLGDVRMIHHRQRLALRLEARDDLLGVHAKLDDFERDTPPHRLALLGDIHHAATAFADFFHQLVAAERLAHGFVEPIIDDIAFDHRSFGFDLCGQQIVWLVVRGEQGVEARAQGFVRSAHDFEKGRAFRRGLFKGQRKQGCFAFLGR